ncbi:YtpI family protein [Paenibacillus sp. FSL H8-0332]|uniref:YtpI family protein n=1 Tax=Paenibacillus sp. FSL H8-0332 TaxID=2954742 RepID=UPI0030CD7D79
MDKLQSQDTECPAEATLTARSSTKELLFMIMFIKYLLFALLVIFMVCAAAYSISSRRSTDPLVQGTKRSIMNMLLGGMLVTLSLMSMFMFRGSTLNVVIETAFLLLGLFNVFSGLRSYSYYSRMRSRS